MKPEKVRTPKPTQPHKGVDKKKAMSLAASWYVAMPSKALGKKLKAVELFGQPLVAWRDQQGKPVIMERYCSHLGASLAIGELVDGCIQCPFHHWRYDRSGNCVFVPEVNHIPPKARQVTYVTTERYGYVWVWYGSQNPLFPLPEFPSAEDNNYIPYRFEFEVETTVRRVAENTYDHLHVVTVHQLKVSGSAQLTLLNNQNSEEYSESSVQKESSFKALIKFPLKNYVGPLGRVVQAFGLDAKVLTLQVDGSPSGHKVTGFIDGEERFQTMGGITPIAENKTVKHSLVMVKKTGTFWLDILYYILFGWQSKNSFTQDIPIWNTMDPSVGDAYVKEDLGVLNFRRFYQNWINKAEIEGENLTE
ncbi:aromatic ring-hydroxylating dioxygenase subunit alpha [Brasilonema sp. UFV-L1]|uniref:Rieske 2Fe-2S domain-containing protein n=1 Tax=Brasilonema sp. UFV-L1 TaxID=2234130 RepID=UPI00145D7613|nr:aromatic ring-hydroxylating dioxygenase subunit alpha [Brasilonema sp. UFV-L1]NMG08666.1 aromatic ring-hydroxylating dioxygenase subunit alpha [Brasilonema sp. UFV-L1]